MQSSTRRARASIAFLCLLGVALAAPDLARANCNLIPAAPDEFRSVQGTVSNTVVAPGNPVRVRLA